MTRAFYCSHSCSRIRLFHIIQAQGRQTGRWSLGLTGQPAWPACGVPSHWEILLQNRQGTAPDDDIWGCSLAFTLVFNRSKTAQVKMYKTTNKILGNGECQQTQNFLPAPVLPRNEAYGATTVCHGCGETSYTSAVLCGTSSILFPEVAMKIPNTELLSFLSWLKVRSRTPTSDPIKARRWRPTVGFGSLDQP